MSQVAILNLFYLGVTLLQGTASKKKGPKKDVKSRDENSYEVSRYVPPLRRMAEEVIAGSLQPAEFPYVRPPGAPPPKPPAADTAARKLVHWASKSAPRAAADGGGRKVVVFVLGGVGYSEVREMHKLGAEAEREVLLGSTGLLTPQEYIIGLKDLKQLETMHMHV